MLPRRVGVSAGGRMSDGGTEHPLVHSVPPEEGAAMVAVGSGEYCAQYEQRSQRESPVPEGS